MEGAIVYIFISRCTLLILDTSIYVVRIMEAISLSLILYFYGQNISVKEVSVDQVGT